MQVYCDSCELWIDEQEVKVINIDEDTYGRDILTFVCPYCKQNKKSIRRDKK